jgi:hypothetical protein
MMVGIHVQTNRQNMKCWRRCFLRSPARSFIKRNCGGIHRHTLRVEAGSNTSTVTLRVVGGDEKGSLKYETVKDDLKSQGTRTRERLRWQGPAAHTKDRSDLSSERAPYKNKTVTVTQVIKIWSLAPDGCFVPKETGRLTVGRNISLALDTQTARWFNKPHIILSEEGKYAELRGRMDTMPTG